MRHLKELLTKRLVLILFSAVAVTIVTAQNMNVKGIVKDTSGEPVIGATVIQKGTSQGVITDFDGRFSLNAPSNSTLLISYIGFTTQEVSVKGKNLISVTLEPESQTLSEVVVVGYGTMRKSDLTGAVGSLGAKEMEKSPVVSVGQAIQGKIAGLQVVDNGKPGDNVAIKIN